MERGNLRRVVDDVTASFAVDENGPKASGRGGNLIAAPRTRTGKRDCRGERGGGRGGGDHPSGKRGIDAVFPRFSAIFPQTFAGQSNESGILRRCLIVVDGARASMCHPRDRPTG